jgi:hypothetical protein
VTDRETKVSCACGAVRLTVVGSPLISSQCYCTSCRDAAARLAEGGYRPVAAPDGGTPYVLYRKDRLRFVSGQDRIRAFRLTPDAPTRRAISTCCNTPLFLEFQGGHWLSLYSNLWPEGGRPAMQIRTMTTDLPAGTTLEAGPPSGRLTTLGFYARLLRAWIAMGFKSPKVQLTGDELNVPPVAREALER